MPLCIFDLDNTLIAGDSDHAWGEFLIERGVVDARHYRAKNDYFYAQYLEARLDINEYLEFALAPLAANDRARMLQLRAEFLRQKITPMLLPKAKTLITKHRQQGDRLLIITSTNSFVAGPICELLGIPDYLASEAEIVEGRFTGKASGVPTYQEGKITRLNTWLEEQQLDLRHSYGYSDSINDLPLLQAVTNAVAVDADDKLKAHAQQQGWPCISLRESH